MGSVLRATTACIAVAAALYGVHALWRDAAVPEDTEPRPLPHFAFTDDRGKEVTEKDFFGKPALVYVWASWCPLCVEGLADLRELGMEFGDTIAVIAINRGESSEITRRFGTPVGGMATGTIFLRDPDDGYYREIGGFAMPETLFIDRDGFIRFHKRGPVGREELRRRIEDAAEN